MTIKRNGATYITPTGLVEDAAFMAQLQELAVSLQSSYMVRDEMLMGNEARVAPIPPPACKCSAVHAYFCPCFRTEVL